MKILIIIPAYNEQDNILRVCKMIEEYNKKAKQKFDYVVINDGSKDNTLNILRENNLNHVNLIRNLGIGGAVQTGYKYAYDNDYDIAVQFDGDGQHDINYVQKICDPIIKEGYDMGIGSRYIKGKKSNFQSTAMRRFGSKLISKTIKIRCKQKITDPTSGFRAANKRTIKLFAKEYPVDYPEPESTALILAQKFKIKEVPVEMHEREAGKSSINPLKSADYMIKVIIAIIINSRHYKKGEL